MTPISQPRQRGFSLLELIMVVALLTIILGVIFRDLYTGQQRYRTEESRLDLTQESREFMDQIVRDLHQSGYPNASMYAMGVLGNPAANDSRNAVGIVSISATDLWFEGDVDQDGYVDSVRYTLQPDASGNCPCTMSRSQVMKLNGVAPMSQTVTYTTDVQNVVNSNGIYPIAGTSFFNGTSMSNNTLYGGYKSAAVFTALDASGTAITLPLNIQNNASTLKSIKTIQINLNVLAPYADMQTGLRPASALTATARLNN